MYPIYYYIAGGTNLMNRRVTPVGVGMILFMVVACVLAGAKTEHERALFQVVALCASIIATSAILALFRRVKLVAVRELPRFATVGDVLSYTVVIENQGYKDVKDAWVLDCDKDRRPTMERFIKTEEPGERDRNIFDRKFVFYRWKWLLDSLILFEPQAARETLRLFPNKMQRVAISLTPTRRGLIDFQNMIVMLPDPLGLFQRNQHIATPHDTVLVLPKRYRLGSFEMPGSITFNLGGEMGASRLGDSGDFVSLRDYRSGDAMRNIHWKSWARTGRPVVKEFENTHYPHYGLLLDTAEHGAQPRVFEEAVSVAASFISTVQSEECLLDLMFYKGEALRVTAGRGVGKPERLLEALAGVEPDPNHSLVSLERLVLQHREDLTGCVLVLCHWSQKRQEFVRKLEAQRIALRIFLVTEDEELATSIIKEFPSPAPVTILVCGRIQESLLHC